MPEPGCIVDTDVVSYLFRNDTRAEQFRPHVTGRILAVSFMTVAELERWAFQRNWGSARRERMTDFLNRFVIVLVDRALCKTWAAVGDQARRNGRPIQVADAWIAATAIALNVPLLTHNRSDYAGVNDIELVPQL